MPETLPRRSERHRRRRGLVVLVVLVILMVGIAGGAGAFYTWATGASGPRARVSLVIPKGATGSDVADLLAQRHVVRSAFAFRLIARFRGFSAGFEAGKYTNLTTNMTAEQALEALKAGPVVETVTVAFPEGLTVAQMAARASAGLGVSRTGFVKAANSGRFSLPPYLPDGKKTVEGFLYPSTYDFLKNVTVTGVIDRLLGQFNTEAERLDLVGRAKALGITPYQAVIIASMIEREARFDIDRPKIAAVIYNRLKRGMALQIDATVEYALDKYKSALTFEDLKVQSPYNTYLHTGLPPTPIASPGFRSLQAALNPAHADYLYYLVIDKAGHHYFTASYQDFLNHKNQVSG